MNRKLDAAIAEALGHDVKKSKAGFYWLLQDGQVGQGNSVPFVSADGDAMLWLEEKMAGRGWWATVQRTGYLTHGKSKISRFRVLYAYIVPSEEPHQPVLVEADTEPLARALAAYKALTGKEWQD